MVSSGDYESNDNDCSGGNVVGLSNLCDSLKNVGRSVTISF